MIRQIHRVHFRPSRNGARILILCLIMILSFAALNAQWLAGYTHRIKITIDNTKVSGTADSMNKSLEFAGRVADYMELAELMAADALDRTESCGGHFRDESQTEDGEALRDDENYSFVSAWEFNGLGKEWTLHRENLEFENVTPTQRSYK